MTAIIGSYSEDFYVSKNEEKCLLVPFIPSIVPEETKTVCTSVYWLFIVFLSIYDRINSLACSSFWMDTIHTMLINSWTDCKNILDKHRLRVMSMCNTQMSMFLLDIVSLLPQNCHKIAIYSIALFIYLCTTPCDQNRWCDKIDFA